MKNLMLFISLFAFTFALSQDGHARNADKVKPVSYNEADLQFFNQGFSDFRSHGCDTLTNLLSTDTISFYQFPDGGYVSGHNNLGDLAKADFFTNPNPGGFLTSALLLFGVAEYADTTSTINVTVWDADANDEPGNILSTEEITIESIAANIAAEQPVIVAFSSPAVVADNFFIGIEFSYAPGDTVALLIATDRGESGLNTAWEQWSDQSWMAYNEPQPTGWGIATSHFILPEICDELSSVFESNQPEELAIYPNPAADFVTINLPDVNGKLNVSLYNLLGKEIISNEVADIQHKHYIQVQDLVPGVYFIQVQNENEIVGQSKLIIQ